MKPSPHPRPVPGLEHLDPIGLPIRFAILTVAIATAQPSRAEIITIPPANVTASSQIGAPFNRQDDFVVDGSGLTGGQHTSAVQPNMWLSTGNGFGGIDPDPSITFDLGAVYTISSFHVWNYNESPPNLTNRGVNSVTVQFGTTAALGSTVPGIANFAQANGLNTYAGENFSGFTPFSARFIKFDINSNHGDGNTFYGLSEVRFDGALSGIEVSPNRFLSSASQGDRVGTLTLTGGAMGDAFTYAFITGEGDTDNGKFQLAGDELQIGPHDFIGAADGAEYSVRLRASGSPSGQQFEGKLTLTAVADSDADRLHDVWEERWAGAGNLAVLSGLGDANRDGDTLTDLEEFDLRDQFPDLDPTQADTDGDDLEDGEEIVGAGQRPPTDPTNPDTDGDTLSDGVETNTGIFRGLTDTGSNPTLADTDADAFGDGIEAVRGSDPNDPDSTPPFGLVGYWPFDAAADPQPDLSGFFNDAAVAAGALWVNDAVRNGVMEFDGNDSFLEAPDSPSLSLTGDFTVAAWVNPTDYSTDADNAPFRGIVAKTENNLPASYDLYFLANNGRPRVLAGSPGGFETANGLTVFPIGEWHHFAVTKIGSDVTVYLDGVVDGQGTITSAMLDSNAPLRIGNRADLLTDFLGRMDDVAIFDGGLTPEQVTDIMGGDFSDFGIGSSDFRITSVLKGETLVEGVLLPSVTLTFTSRPGKRYKIDASTGLTADGTPGGWFELDDSFLSQGNSSTYVDTLAVGTGAPQLFYRILEAP